MSHSLCWLGLAKNRLRKISGLGNLSSLAVLDLSDNRVSRPGHEMALKKPELWFMV